MSSLIESESGPSTVSTTAVGFEDEWDERMSRTHGRQYWFNKRTGESVWERPTTATTTEVPSPSPSPAAAVSSVSSSSGAEATVGDDITCPQNLSGKRDFLFRGYDATKKTKFVIDEVAAFSVTESQSADEMTRVILAEAGASATTILDGMACVGGNTISFAKGFRRVLSNDLDEGRYGILRHNVSSVMECTNVEFFNDSILELVKRVEFDVLFLDPEWGGPGYKDATSLLLTISDVAMEDFVLQVEARIRSYIHTYTGEHC